MLPGSGGRPSGRLAASALFALVAGAIGFGAWTGFPVFSDAIVPLLVHDSGVRSLAARHADRPLYGWVLQATVAAVGFRRLAWIAVDLAAWGLLAWLTARLFRLVFPEHARWSWLPALLVLSPIVVQTQFVTLTIAYPGVAPVALVLAGLLAGAGRAGWRGVVVPFALSLIAASISEYSVAAALGAAVVALGLRERRAAVCLGAGAAAGFLLFKLTADPSGRPDVTADSQLPRLAAAPVAGLYRWLSGAWHTAIGAYGGAIWHPQLDVKAHSSAAVAALGVAGAVLAAVAGASARRPQADADDPPAPPRLTMLVVAVAAAVLPVAAAGRATSFDAAWIGEYETRFLLPAVPFASVLVAGALARGVTPSAAPAAAALVGFLCVETAWQGAFQARRTQRWVEQLSRELLPVVRSSSDFVVAVGDDDPTLRWGSILTGKLTASWHDEDARRFWALPRGWAARAVGGRAGCRAPETIRLDQLTRWVRRSVRVGAFLWVPAGDRVAPLEPYCLGPRAP